MFINFSNHRSDQWGGRQLSAAHEYGEIVDIEFPGVSATASVEEVHALADTYVKKIVQMNPSCVLCQGEFCLSYQVIYKLKQKDIRVVAACSNRKVREIKEGEYTKKISCFVFEQFREY